jgi:hypothetical protein
MMPKKWVPVSRLREAPGTTGEPGRLRGLGSIGALEHRGNRNTEQDHSFHKAAFPDAIGANSRAMLISRERLHAVRTMLGIAATPGVSLGLAHCLMRPCADFSAFSFWTAVA